MSITSATRFEFRCTSCYQSLLADTEAAGSGLKCQWCGNSMIVPAPTKEAIDRARDCEGGGQALEGTKIVQDEPCRSPEERAELARQLSKQQAKSRDVRCRKPADRGASRIARLVAVLVDAFVFSLTCGLCVAFALLAYDMRMPDVFGRAGSVPLGFWLAAIGIPGALVMLHWFTVSMYGKTIGKFLLKIRIVDSSGYAPGFMCGVVIRQSIAGITTLVPWIPILDQLEMWPQELAITSGTTYTLALIGCMALALADVFAIFLEPPRCLHDRLAGTYVIDD